MSATAAAADVASADAALVLARATDERVAGLYSRRSATADERDRAVAEKAAAEGRAAAARARQQSALAARDAAREAARMSGIVSGYATLVAPFDGVVTDRYADPGSMASPGLALLTLERRGTYRLEVPLDESRAAFVRTGQPVEVVFDAPGERQGRSRSGPAKSAASSPPLMASSSRSTCQTASPGARGSSAAPDSPAPNGGRWRYRMLPSCAVAS